MEKYEILNVKRSIVEPDMVDVTLGRNGNFVTCCRVSGTLKNVVYGAKCIMHEDVLGRPVAYCFGDEMYIVNTGTTSDEMCHQISKIAGIATVSLDRFYFYMALRAAMKHQGMKPSVVPAKNMLILSQLQQKSHEK